MNWVKRVTLLSLTLTLSQAALAAAPQSTPEIGLVSSMIALSGQKLSAEEMRSQVMAELQQYNASAPAEGRIERTEQALVALGVSTPEQAQSFGEQARSASMALANGQLNSFQSQLISAVSRSKGAQFDLDACELAGTVDFVTFVGGISLGLAGALDTVLDADIGIFIAAWTLGMLACN